MIELGQSSGATFSLIYCIVRDGFSTEKLRPKFINEKDLINLELISYVILDLCFVFYFDFDFLNFFILILNFRKSLFFYFRH